MSREWKPGDVGMSNQGRVFYSSNARWIFDDHDGPGTDSPRGLRPLVVIDPEDREQVALLLSNYHSWKWTAGIAEASINDMQDALRALVAEPQPEEPKATGAIVRDADEELWVRRRGGPWDCLNSPAGKDVLGWADLCRKYGPLTVLSEGYSGEGS